MQGALSTAGIALYHFLGLPSVLYRIVRINRECCHLHRRECDSLGDVLCTCYIVPLYLLKLVLCPLGTHLILDHIEPLMCL